MRTPQSGSGAPCDALPGAQAWQECEGTDCTTTPTPATTQRTSPSREPTEEGGEDRGASPSRAELERARARGVPARGGDSLERRDRKRVASSLSIAADIAEIAPGSSAREAFESDFRSTMADRLGALVEPADILIDEIRSGGAAAGRRVIRRHLQDASITVEFSILADEDQATAAQDAAATLQTSSTPLALSVGGEVVMVTPSVAMTPPSAPAVADLDCEGTWTCDAESCSLIFTRTQAQSGSGEPCPDEMPCVCVDPAATTPAADDSSPPIGIIIAATAGATGLVLVYCCCSRRRGSAVSSTSVAQSPTQSKQHGSAGSRPSASKGGARGRRDAAVSPGAAVRVYSKSKDIWCPGRVVAVNGDAVEVAYTIGGRDTKERRKTLRIDSDNLEFTQQLQRRGPYP